MGLFSFFSLCFYIYGLKDDRFEIPFKIKFK